MYNGMINIYKEKGYTSHDIVAKLRGILKMKKIGHTGTLDPDACGVLLVCLGNATKLCDMLMDWDKTYEAVLLLGKTTDTQDISGELIREAEILVSEKEAVREIESFVGEYDQLPPMYSALKVNGKKLYELAREGKEIERKKRKVKIKEIQILSVEFPRIRMRVRCSKGTYIRTLCHDIGEKLGCGGCMEALIRTGVGQFCADSALKLGEVERLEAIGCLKEKIVSAEQILSLYPECVVKEAYVRLLENGNPFSEDMILSGGAKEGWIRAYDYTHKFIGIYEYCSEKMRFYPVKMFFN